MHRNCCRDCYTTIIFHFLLLSFSLFNRFLIKVYILSFITLVCSVCFIRCNIYTCATTSCTSTAVITGCTFTSCSNSTTTCTNLTNLCFWSTWLWWYCLRATCGALTRTRTIRWVPGLYRMTIGGWALYCTYSGYCHITVWLALAPSTSRSITRTAWYCIWTDALRTVTCAISSFVTTWWWQTHWSWYWMWIFAVACFRWTSYYTQSTWCNASFRTTKQGPSWITVLWLLVLVSWWWKLWKCFFSLLPQNNWIWFICYRKRWCWSNILCLRVSFQMLFLRRWIISRKSITWFLPIIINSISYLFASLCSQRMFL